ncbi:hypothetical protein DVH24_025675 [Malus domestica]|uniref:Uncharacterized protein n=1 Tax=Malus domestica TaxID=3750 RepID=A0A498KEE7_MALDO|nr:hypothetical protein DVH24_025675 [Malus domestica]
MDSNMNQVKGHRAQNIGGASLESLVVLLLVAAYQDYKALKLSRYSYADGKTITIQFIDKGDQEEFINKGGTMGHINHAIPLVGFCVDGFRRAVVH